MSEWERIEIVRDYAEARATLIAVAQLQTVLGLAMIEHGQKMKRPGYAQRAGKQLLFAIDLWQRAGMSRKAAAVGRLLDRCRRAWNRHMENEGYR